MTTTLSLSGNNTYNPLNLSGQSIIVYPNIPLEINQLKSSIINKFIIPIKNKQWTTLHENLFTLNRIKTKINHYYDSFKTNDLLVYKELVDTFESIDTEHQKLEILNNNMNNVNKTTDANNVSNLNFSTLAYKTAMLKLKPEYEIYNLVIGKPNIRLQQKYNEYIIKDIEKLLSVDNITFSKIKEIITKKYRN